MKRKMIGIIAGCTSILLFSSIAFAAGTATAIKAQLRGDYTIQVNGEAVTFKDDANGKTLSPITYEGRTYLPARAVAEYAGMDVNWDSKTKTVSLTTKNTNGQQGNNQTNNNQNQGNYIGEAKAKSIALTDAGLKESAVTFIKTKLEFDDGKYIYDVEFYQGNKEYDYEIDAVKGTILSKDYDIEDDTPNTNNGSIISETKATSIVLEKVPGATSSNVSLHLDRDDGRQIYEGEVRYGGYEYEFELDAKTGKVLSWEKDRIDD